MALRRQFRRRALACAGLAALAAAPELVLRARRGAPPSEDLWLSEMRYEESEAAKPFFVPRPSAAGVRMVPNRARSTAEAFAAEKRPGEKRVFLVGESVAQRLPARALSARLTRALGAPASVINCGMGAYGSFLVAAVADEVLRDRPDLLVVMTGNNDGAGPERTWYPLYRANRALRRSWSWRLAQDWAVSRFARPPGPAEREARFERNLRRILQAARRAGVPAVVATLPVNLRGYPPLGELPLQRADFLAGSRALEEGRPRDAAAAFGRDAAAQPADAMAHYWLARSLDAAGDAAAAGPEYEKAVEDDYPSRCPPSRGAAIRRVAAEEGAAVADIERLVRGRAVGGIPGWDEFADGVHWRRGLDAAAEEEIARAAARGARPASADDRKAAARAASALSKAWNADESRELELRAISDAVQEKAEYDPPILLERVVAEFEQADAADPRGLAARLGDPASAEAELRRNEWTEFLADRTRPSWGLVLAHAGEALARRGETVAALAALRRAAQADPSAGLPPFLTGKTLLESGRRGEALRAWDAIPPDTRERAMAAFYGWNEGGRP